MRENRDNLARLFEQSKGIMSPEATIVSEGPAIRCELAAEVLRSSGKLRFPVIGWSMLPSVFPGDTLLVESSDSSDVAEGDIVVFRSYCRLVAHRVIRGSKMAGLVTQGDALSVPDAMVRKEEMLGKVVGISRNGKHMTPRKRMRFAERAVAACVRHSIIVARLVVALQSLRQVSPV